MSTTCKITVLKKNLDTELAKEYCQSEVMSCPVFEEGQEFITGFEKPEGFCDWAWMIFIKLWRFCFLEVIFQRVSSKDG